MQMHLCMHMRIYVCNVNLYRNSRNRFFSLFLFFFNHNIRAEFHISVCDDIGFD